MSWNMTNFKPNFISKGNHVHRLSKFINYHVDFHIFMMTISTINTDEMHLISKFWFMLMASRPKLPNNKNNNNFKKYDDIKHILKSYVNLI